MNPSSIQFDSALLAVGHFKSFPAMTPFVGVDYINTNHSKLLILGESFYFPEESILHKEPSTWYASSQASLNDEEISHFNCRELLECEWKSDGHKMYREINRCLEEVGVTASERAISHICFTNTFMRPARDPGGSFMHCCSRQDIEISIDVLTKIINAVTPEMVIFSSVFSWNTVGKTLEKQIQGTCFDFVSHPTDPFHWNVESYPNGRKKFISLLEKWSKVCSN